MNLRMSESSARFWLVALVVTAVIIISGMVAGGIKPPPRLDWAFAAIPLLYLAWVGSSLFRLARALVRIGINLLDLRREARVAAE